MNGRVDNHVGKPLVVYAMTGSFCSFERSLRVASELAGRYELLPVMSENAYSTDTRFGAALDIADRLADICGREVLHTIAQCEPIGPKLMPDAVVVAPCTGNTLAKLAHGITDTSVTMAVKSQLRRGAPVLLALASNDSLGANFENLGRLSRCKHIYFAPLIEDDPERKPYSLVAELERIPEALECALRGVQLTPRFSVNT